MSGCHQFDEKAERQKFLDKIKESGGRITEQRKAMISVILGFKTPFSADQILGKMKKTSIDIATIYRSLNHFEDLGCLRSVDLSDGVTRYEYSLDQAHHHHIICKKCRKIEAFDFCELKNYEMIIKKMGYQDISHKLEFFGFCSKCSK
jgi:Fur family ferric uptake transcriptional regulator